MLPPTPRHHAADRAPVLEEGAVAVLLLAVAWDQLLNHRLPGTDERGGPPEPLVELGAGIGAPGLGLRRVDEVLLDRWLDRNRRLDLHLLKLGNVPRVPGPRNRDLEILCKPVRVPLVPRPLDHVPL